MVPCSGSIKCSPKWALPQMPSQVFLKGAPNLLHPAHSPLSSCVYSSFSTVPKLCFCSKKGACTKSSQSSRVRLFLNTQFPLYNFSLHPTTTAIPFISLYQIPSIHRLFFLLLSFEVHYPFLLLRCNLYQPQSLSFLSTFYNFLLFFIL